MSEDYVVKSAFPQVVKVDAHNFKIHMATDRAPIILSLQRHTAKHTASETDFYPFKTVLKKQAPRNHCPSEAWGDWVLDEWTIVIPPKRVFSSRHHRRRLTAFKSRTAETSQTSDSALNGTVANATMQRSLSFQASSPNACASKRWQISRHGRLS
jgi:hypothetical protein